MLKNVVIAAIYVVNRKELSKENNRKFPYMPRF